MKFPGRFSDTVISASSVYGSPNLCIELTGCAAASSQGEPIYYTLAIHTRSISCLRTGFAQDTYGIGYRERLSAMSERMRSILAVNGDSYSNRQGASSGTVIRNRTVYCVGSAAVDTFVLFRDGTMAVYPPDSFRPERSLPIAHGRADPLALGFWLRTAVPGRTSGPPTI